MSESENGEPLVIRDSLIQFVGFFTSSLKDGVDREIALTRLLAELHAEFSRGVEDAASICEEVGRKANNRAVSYLATAIRELRIKNDAQFESTIHS